MTNRIAALFSLCILIGLPSCNAKHEEKKENPTYIVTTPQVKDTTVIRKYVCQIKACKHIELRALESGYLQNIFVDEGQKVAAGQRMFQIMPNVYKADLSKANAEAQTADIEYKNTKALADKNVVSKNELALAAAKLAKARAEVELAATHLSFTTIKAPFSGIMDHLNAREGSLLEEGELLTMLSDNSKMWVYFNVSEAEYLNYMLQRKKGTAMTVQLEMANGVLFNQTGKVETIEGEFNNETGSIAFRATFANPEALLRHGETGNILVRHPHAKALLIPQKATFEILDKIYVFVVDAQNRVHQREITVSEEEIPNLFMVTKGLKPTEKILLDGLRKVKDGQQIQSKYQKPEIVLSSLDVYAE